MLCRLYKEKKKINPVVIVPHQIVLSTVDSVDNGVLSRRSSYVYNSVADDFKKFTVSDFSIGNIVALGKVSSLHEVSMVNNDFTSISSQIDKFSKVDSHE